MKTFTKIALAATLILVAGGTATAQQEENPLYGNTVAERQENAKALSFLRDEVNMKNWDYARGYVKQLMNGAPKASLAIYQYGVQVYRALTARATSVAEKNVMIDSIMLIYDRRVENFGNAVRSGNTVKHMKAIDYLTLRPMDRANIRKFYKEAVDAEGANASPKLVLEYFQQLAIDFKGTEITPEEMLAAYEQLAPLMEKAPAEERDQFTALFATSGAADCGVLEELYTKQLAANPGDKDLLKKAYVLMSSAKCDGDFYVSVAEQLYALEPTSDLAVRLAMIFEKNLEFDRALPYINQMLETETDPIEKSNLYVRVAASEYGQKRYSGTAQAARQAIQLNPDNGVAHFFLASAYMGGASACGAFQSQTVMWLAYDELIRARDGAAGDATLLETINSSIAGCRARFPAREDAFMYIDGYTEGKSYTVSCGWISGTTTIRTR